MAEKPVDIRTVPQDEYWKVFENRWTSLLSYRYIGRVDDELDANPTGVGSMRLRYDMRNAVGGVMVAPLCIFSPEAGGMNDNRQVPNPVSQAVHILDDGRGVTRVRSIRDTLRLGRQMGFSRSMIVDEDDPKRVLCISEGIGVSIGAPPSDYAPVDNPHIQIEDSPDLPPLHQVFGATKGSDGQWRLPELSLEMASPDAALHLGPQHIVLETAATDAAAEAAGTDRLQIEAYNCMFMARGKVGPFVARTEVIPSGGKFSVRTILEDEGNEGRAVTSAIATFGLVP
jgi:hypothetical protein